MYNSKIKKMKYLNNSQKNTPFVLKTNERDIQNAPYESLNIQLTAKTALESCDKCIKVDKVWSRLSFVILYII